MNIPIYILLPFHTPVTLKLQISLLQYSIFLKKKTSHVLIYLIFHSSSLGWLQSALKALTEALSSHLFNSAMIPSDEYKCFKRTSWLN